MKNKKVLIAIIIVLVLVAAAVIGLVIVNPFKKDDEKEEKKVKNETSQLENIVKEENDEDDIDYKSVLEEFVKACKDEESMEEFIDEYVDLKSLYAAMESDSPKDFVDVYDKTKKSDYEDEEFMENVKELFNQYVTDEEITISDVEKDKDRDMSDIGIDNWTIVTFNVEMDGDEEELAAIFCKDKIVLVSTDDVIDLLLQSGEEDDEDVIDDTADKMSEQEVKMFNAGIEKYEGDSVKGSEVKLLLDEVISSNASHDELVSVSTSNLSSISDTNSSDDTDIRNIKSKISSGKNYKVSFNYASDGRIEEVVIENE